MKKTLLAVLLAFIAAPAYGQATEPAATQPAAVGHRLLLVSIDGLRPDLLLRAATPHFHALFESGSFSFWARTTPVSITLPSHVSMLTGVVPRRHEIEWDMDLPLSKPFYPKFPTLFEVAKRAGLTTAMAVGKSKLGLLDKPGTIDWSFVPDRTVIDDDTVRSHAIEIIHEHQPAVMFVHLPAVDTAGHAFGWGSPQQINAIEGADAAVGAILAALDDAKVLRDTYVIVTADHGGAGRSHVPDDPRSRHIPWIVVGPGIRKNLDLTTYPNLVINTEDTFATACALLKLQPGKELDGKPILEILDRGELLEDKPR